MDTYRPRYYIVDWVLKAVWHIVHLARHFLASMAPSSSLHRGGDALAAGTGLSQPTSWTELLQLMPSSYMRLVITLEMSISHGKLPEESDFPPTLRSSAHISFALPPPGAGRFLEAGRHGEDDGAEEARVVEVADEQQPADQLTSYDFDLAAAMDFIGGDEVSFQTPQPTGPDGGFAGVAGGSAGAEASLDGAGLDGFFEGEFPGGDEFDDWASRLLGPELAF